MVSYFYECRNRKRRKKAKLFRALSEPNRIRIIKILRDSDRELTCGQISHSLKIAPSTVSYHFKALRRAGLTRTRKQAQIKYLSLNQQTFQEYLPNLLNTL